MEARELWMCPSLEAGNEVNFRTIEIENIEIIMLLNRNVEMLSN